MAKKAKSKAKTKRLDIAKHDDRLKRIGLNERMGKAIMRWAMVLVVVGVLIFGLVKLMK
ncbi:MAG: hypothetical protein WCJ46_00040 [bacterium]